MKTGKIAISLDPIASHFQIPWKVLDAKIDDHRGVLELTFEGNNIPGEQKGDEPIELVGTAHTDDDGQITAIVWKHWPQCSGRPIFIRSRESGLCFFCKRPESDHISWPVHGLVCPSKLSGD